MEEYVEERRREEVIRELEHELGTPDLREFPVAGEEAEQVKNEYESGELSLFELEERLEEILSRNE